MRNIILASFLLSALYLGCHKDDKDFRLISVCQDQGNIVIRDLNSFSDPVSFKPPWAKTGGDFTDFKVSPDARKVMLAVVWNEGSVKERGAIYILDINSGQFKLFKHTKKLPQLVAWQMDK